MELFGDAVVNNLMYIDGKEFQEEDMKITLTLYLPHPKSTDKSVLRSANDRCYLYVNKRPIDWQPGTKLINAHIRKHYNSNSILKILTFQLKKSTHLCSCTFK